MEFVMPLKISSISANLPFPISLIDGASIESFELADKERFFNLVELRIKGDQITFQQSNSITGSNRLLDYHDYILSNYAVVIRRKTENPAELRRIQKAIDFAFKIVIGCGFPIVETRDTSTILNNSKYFSNKHIISHRKISSLGRAELERLQKLILLIQQQIVQGEKMSLLKFMFDEAMAQVPNLGISGAFYVSILESIFVPDNAPEIGYRLSMRMTRHRGKNVEYLNKIKKYYNKRSTLFHSGKDSFTKEELMLLEEEAALSIEEYIYNHKNFTQESLDKLLLQS